MLYLCLRKTPTIVKTLKFRDLPPLERNFDPDVVVMQTSETETSA
jgi:hypothetical protein